MKKLILFLSILLLHFMPLCAGFSWDDISPDYPDTQINGVYYYIDRDREFAMVTCKFIPDDQGTSQPEYGSYEGDIHIPASINAYGRIVDVVGISPKAFAYCSNLQSVTISGNANSNFQFGEFSFYNSSVRTITCGERTEYIIRDSAFRSCALLRTFDLGTNSIENIEESAFEDCTNLSDFTFPESLPMIQENAFRNCTSLTSVTIPENLTWLGHQAFQGCTGLTEIRFNAINCNEYQFFDHVLSEPFDGCINVEKLVFGNNVKIIQPRFTNFSKLAGVNLPESVEYIGSDSFDGCSGLQSPIHNSKIFVKLHPEFEGIYEIPDGITTIIGGAFTESRKVTDIMIPEGVTTSTGVLCYHIQKPLYNNKLFAYLPQSYDLEYTVPDGIESIGGGAFFATKIPVVKLPESLKTISDNAFMSCKLGYVNIPPNVESIGRSAFSFCTTLTELTIPNRVNAIPDLIGYRSAIRKITLGKGVKTVHPSSFNGMDNLVEIVSYAIGAPENGSNYFSLSNENIVLRVPREYRASYRTSPAWSKIKNIESIESVLCVSVLKNIFNAGEIEGAGDYTDNEQVSLVAKPANGYVFDGWYCGTELLSKDCEYSFNYSERLFLDAKFSPIEDENSIINNSTEDQISLRWPYTSGLHYKIEISDNEGNLIHEESVSGTTFNVSLSDLNTDKDNLRAAPNRRFDSTSGLKYSLTSLTLDNDIFDFSTGNILDNSMGINDIHNNETDSVTYYSLEGFVVTRPIKGKIYILKERDSVKKIIF